MWLDSITGEKGETSIRSVIDTLGYPSRVIGVKYTQEDLLSPPAGFIVDNEDKDRYGIGLYLFDQYSNQDHPILIEWRTPNRPPFKKIGQEGYADSFKKCIEKEANWFFDDQEPITKDD